MHLIHHIGRSGQPKLYLLTLLNLVKLVNLVNTDMGIVAVHQIDTSAVSKTVSVSKQQCIEIPCAEFFDAFATCTLLCVLKFQFEVLKIRSVLSLGRRQMVSSPNVFDNVRTMCAARQTKRGCACGASVWLLIV